MSMYYRLTIGEKATMEIPGARWHKKYPCSRPRAGGSLTRVNSTNVLDEGLRLGGRTTTRDSGIEIGTRCTQVHVPAVEDRYILLAI
jgi:hypothetical protein